jgi:hypothetical protein
MSSAKSPFPKLLLVAALLVAAPAQADPALVSGQTLYVPAYSHIAYGSGKGFLRLRTTLSLRNLDRTAPITIIRVDAHDGEGTLVTEHLVEPVVLAPLATHEIALLESEAIVGGGGASLIVTWTSAQPAVAPLIETIMIGTAGTQGISFVGRARVLDEVGP